MNWRNLWLCGLIFAELSLNASGFEFSKHQDFNYYLDSDGGDKPEIAGCNLLSESSSCTSPIEGNLDQCSLDGINLSEALGPATCSAYVFPSIYVLSCEDYCWNAHTRLGGKCSETTLASCGSSNLLGYCDCTAKNYYKDTDGGENPEDAGCILISKVAVSCNPATVGPWDACGADGQLNERIGPNDCTEEGSTSFKIINCHTYCFNAHGQTGQCTWKTIPACDDSDPNTEDDVGYCFCYDK